MHVGYPLGGALGSQIARAFVSTNTTTNDTSSKTSLLVTKFQDIVSSSTDDFLDESRIEIGFLIISCINLALAVFFILFQFTGRARFRKKFGKRSFKWSEILYPSNWAGGDAKFGLFIFIMSTLFQVILQGCDKGLAQFLTTYAVDSDLGFDNQEAASLSSIYFLVGALGMFICVFITKYLSIKAMFLIEVHGMILLSTLLIMVGTRTRMALYVLAPAYSLFQAPAWPTSYAWPDFYIVLLSVLLGGTRITKNIADIFMNALQGYLYSNTVIESIFYTTFAYGASLCILVYIVYYYTWNKPGRHQMPEDDKQMYVHTIIEGGLKGEPDASVKSAKQNAQTVITHF